MKYQTVIIFFLQKRTKREGEENGDAVGLSF